MFFIGLDLGQRRDFSAAAVVQRTARMTAWPPKTCYGFAVVHLERMPLGTPYTRVAERVCAMMRDPKVMGEARVVVDATGVGAPVVDLLQAAGLGARMTAVTITGGEQARGSGERWWVPKRDLLAGLDVLLEAGELTISRHLKDAALLVKELEAMRGAAEGPRGKALAETGEHDDLAMAVALACWRARRSQNSFGTRRLPGI